MSIRGPAYNYELIEGNRILSFQDLTFLGESGRDSTVFDSMAEIN